MPYLHHAFEFTHGHFAIAPFGLRTLGDSKFTPAAHFGTTGGMVKTTIVFPEQQFDRELDARKFAEERAKAALDSGELKL
ncbi:MAG TPA: hypothetical protein VIP05_23465 [Burkholderiaceae bacterium]